MHEVNGSHLSELFGLQGKTAVVTGASSGIGAAVASLFLAAGARLALAAATLGKLEATVGRLRSESGRAEDVFGVPTDISEEAQVIALFEQAVARYGRVDVLVSCAGIFPVVPFLESTVALWDQVHAVNTRGAYLCTREAIRTMLADDKGGSIVAVSSWRPRGARSSGTPTMVPARRASTCWSGRLHWNTQAGTFAPTQ